jgi:tetratricopeptide (TPR) repeat protein
MPIQSHHAFKEPDKNSFNHFKKELNIIRLKLNKTLELDRFYDETSHVFVGSSQVLDENFRQHTLRRSEVFIDGIEDDDTYLYKSKVFEIAAYAYTINNQLEKSIEISKRSIELSKEIEHVPRYKIYNAYKDIITNYLKLNKYDFAQKYLKEILSLSTVKGFNYFQMKGLEYMLYAYSKEYDNLYEMTLKVIASKSIKDFQINLEQWKLREAFANILLEAGKIDKKITSLPNYKKFKLNKFLNEVEFFSKDKRGTNISILIVELMHFLIRKEYDKLHSRLDALNQYTYRYLRNDHTLRSNCFIKMLLKLPEAEYHPLRTERYVKKYEKKLRENPFKISLKSIDVEIIPYEHLWEIILDILDDNKK